MDVATAYNLTRGARLELARFVRAPDSRRGGAASDGRLVWGSFVLLEVRVTSSIAPYGHPVTGTPADHPRILLHVIRPASSSVVAAAWSTTPHRHSALASMSS